jgi:hypothetical protein
MEVTTQDKIKQVYTSMMMVSLEKNSRYGNSALEPLNIFCKESSDIQIKSRLDDKLARVKNSQELRKNDISDLLGYLTLLCISKDWLDFSDQID